MAIGNSFSQDATRYLHQIGKADNLAIKVVNLYIGGCSLAIHYKNINNDERAYKFEFNGANTGIHVSIKEALQSDTWDFVTMQQVSNLSVDYETFIPYITTLSEYISFHAPKAEQMLHQTWAYEEGCTRLCNELGYVNQYDMFSNLKLAYEKASSELGGLRIIPCGEAFQNLIKNKVMNIHRDTFHANLGIGRYTLAATWYDTLTGRSVLGNKFNELDEAVDTKLLKLAQKCAHDAADVYLKR